MRKILFKLTVTPMIVIEALFCLARTIVLMPFLILRALIRKGSFSQGLFDGLSYIWGPFLSELS